MSPAIKKTVKIQGPVRAKEAASPSEEYKSEGANPTLKEKIKAAD